MQKRGVKLNYLFILLIFLSSFIAFFSLSQDALSYDAYLNISLKEYIYQNKTYEFNLTAGENRTFWFANGTLNISNQGIVTVSDAYILITQTARIKSNFTYFSGRPSVQIEGEGGSGANILIHVPELRPGDFTFLTYQINESDINAPLIYYNRYDHEFAPKVLAEEDFRVNATCFNNISGLGLDANLDITNINITIDTLPMTWTNYSLTENFTFHGLYSENDSSNVTQVDNRTWHWIVSGGTLSSGSTRAIRFNVTAPRTQSTGTYLAMRSTLRYQIADTVSNITFSVINATAQIDFNMTKRLVKYNDPVSHSAVWESIPGISTPINVTYNLTKVSLWVTTDLNPNNTTGINTTYVLNIEVNLTQAWTGTPWLFNFTDGFDDSNPPPIIWMKPEFIIRNQGTQFINSSYTYNGADYYMTYIFVVQGYWLEVTKKISNTALDQYKVDIWVHNKGNSPTPINMTVTVYDFVPSNFTAFDFTPIYTSNESVGSGEFVGVAYKWDLGLNYSGNSTSLGPNDYAAGGTDEWNATYYVNGTGEYKVSGLYIVGLDPRQVDGAYTSPFVGIIKKIKNSSFENVYYFISAGLIIANLTAVFIVYNINKKKKFAVEQSKNETQNIINGK